MQPPQLEPGRYCCIHTGTFSGWIIRRATRSDFDHVILIGPDGSTLEATPRLGVHVGSLSAYKGRKAAANTRELLTEAQCVNVLSAAAAYLGDGYGWQSVGYDALADLGWHWRFLLRLCRLVRRLDCSQYVAQSGADAGLMSWLCGETSAVAVNPGELARRPGVEPVEI